ncbi:MAG: ATP-binding domain-containing protein, partial [Waterburya sp.]
IELTEVYRQALDNPIILLAHRILSGSPIAREELDSYSPDTKKLKFHPWKKDNVFPEQAVSIAGRFYNSLIDAGKLDPEEDIILCPYNKAFGTIELNKHIANHLARKRGAETFEIIAGFNKHYFSPGDKVMYDKSDEIILSIEKNAAYMGAPYQSESPLLNYWGQYDSPEDADKDHESSKSELTEEDFDEFLLNMSIGGEDRVNQASHIVKLKLLDSDREVSVSDAGGINLISLGYAITIHKAQGSEWRNVYLCFHSSHAKMISRELLYTAVTRAREYLHIICAAKTFDKGITTQRIKGDSLEEKIEFFKGKQNDGRNM